MLDKRSEVLLRIINRECNEGSYKVIEIDDIIRLMPNKFRVDIDAINHLMGFLQNGEYISIKYSDKEVFCVSPLPRGRRVFEVEQEEKKMSKRKFAKFIFLSFFYLMLIFGACLGAAYVARLM